MASARGSRSVATNTTRCEGGKLDQRLPETEGDRPKAAKRCRGEERRVVERQSWTSEATISTATTAALVT
jgi:hypothetical protein